MDVHMNMFQMGPFLLSCIMKLNNTAKNTQKIKTLSGLLVLNNIFFKLTSKAHEEAEEDRIKEAKANDQNVLMHQCRQCKHTQHGCWSETLLRHLQKVTANRTMAKFYQILKCNLYKKEVGWFVNFSCKAIKRICIKLYWEKPFYETVWSW